MSSFSLLGAGGWKARYASSRGCFGLGVLTAYWRFQRSPTAQATHEDHHHLTYSMG